LKRTVICLPSDTHSGSTLGLMPPKQFCLHEGGFYDPTPGQKLIWNQWTECWEKIKKERKNSDLIVVHGGDLVEGIHHDTVQIISPRIDEHEDVARLCLDWAFRKVGFHKGDKYYQIGGSGAHAGNGSSSEERIAKDFDGAIPLWKQQVYDEEGDKINGRFTHDRLYRSINGVVFDISHHGGSIGQRAWTTENGLYNKLKSIYFSCLENKMPMPRYWIRGHNHVYVRAEYRGKLGTITGIMLPGFQIRTDYCYRKINYDPQPATIGMCYIIVEASGQSSDYVEKITVEQEHLEDF
jgi:hypothetical protein